VYTPPRESCKRKSSRRYGEAATAKCLLACVNAITQVVKTRVLGTIASLSQWEFPFDDSGKAVDPRTVNNATGRKFIQSLHEMVQVAFAEGLDDDNKDKTRMRNSTLQQDWIQLSTIINALMARTRQQDDFSTEEIAEYHDLCGDFLGKWIDLAGETKHVTNYIHIVGSVHLVHFLREFGNLCKLSKSTGMGGS